MQFQNSPGYIGLRHQILLSNHLIRVLHKPLPMPLQGLLSRPPMAKVDKLAAGGHEGAKKLAAYYVGQAVGLMNSEQSVRSVVYEFMRDYADAVERLSATLGD